MTEELLQAPASVSAKRRVVAAKLKRLIVPACKEGGTSASDQSGLVRGVINKPLGKRQLALMCKVLFHAVQWWGSCIPECPLGSCCA